MNINIKRIYEQANQDDGVRILVDRLWPRGLTKEKARINFWMKEIAPSNELRQWFNHDPGKWNEFKKRYFDELQTKMEEISRITEQMKQGTVTLVYSAKDQEYNQARAIKEYIISH